MERRRFPRIPVYTQIQATLRHRDIFLSATLGNISMSGLMVHTERSLEPGSIVDFEFRLLDEVRPFVGSAEVMWSTKNPKGEPNTYSLGLEIRQIRGKRLGLMDLGRQVAHMHETGLKMVLEAMRYAHAEMQGNLTNRELGQVGAGFRRPLLLIHGWFGTRGALFLLERYLKKKGYPVFSINLGVPNIRNIEENAQLVCIKVARLVKRLHLNKIDVLGHSMGGLIGLWGCKKLDLHRHVEQLICVGTPFQGTKMAYVGMPLFGLVSQSLRQMTPNSSFLQRLHEGPLPANVAIYCFAARNDLVVPIDSAILDGAKNIMVAGSHASLVTSEKVFRQVLAVLEGRDPFAQAEGD